MNKQSMVSDSTGLVLALIVYPCGDMDDGWHYAAGMSDDLEDTPGKPMMVWQTRIIVPGERTIRTMLHMDVSSSMESGELRVSWVYGFASIDPRHVKMLPSDPYLRTSRQLKAGQEEHGMLENGSHYGGYPFAVKACCSIEEARAWLDEKVTAAAKRGDEWMESYKSSSTK